MITETVIKLTKEELQWLHNLLVDVLQNSSNNYLQTYEDWDYGWKLLQALKEK